MEKLSTKVFLVSVILFSLFSACSVQPVSNVNTVTYTVTFDSQGGSAITPQTVVAGAKAAEPTAPVLTNYLFAGWYKESGCVNPWVFSNDTVVSNTTLYAKWVLAYIVTFDSQGGSAVAPQAVVAGGKAVEPSPPSKTDNLFAGWYKESGCVNAWVFSTGTVVSNITLFAKWEGISSVSYSTNGGGITISDCTNTLTGTLYIPETIDGYAVTAIGNNAFQGCTGLTNIVLPSGITSIGVYAFQGCSSLLSATIPAGITNIGSNTFQNCAKLTNVVIPDSVATIANMAFANCGKLSNINIPSGVTTIGNNAFQNCVSMASIIIPNGVTVIANFTFINCTRLTNVVLPSGITSIGEHAFNSCNKLPDFTIPNGVTNIGNYAFQSCAGLTNIVFGANLKTIGDYSFGSCNGLTFIEIPDNVTSVGDMVFVSCYYLTNAVLGNGLTALSYGMFYNCKGLIVMTIPAGITSIESWAFNNCSNMNNLSMHPMAAPTLSSTPFAGVTNCTLHLHSGATGYNIAPWTDTSIFSSVVYDL
jgi:uncharacterized repeat protein (TIGR02543 family)